MVWQAIMIVKIMDENYFCGSSLTKKLESARWLMVTTNIKTIVQLWLSQMDCFTFLLNDYVKSCLLIIIIKGNVFKFLFSDYILWLFIESIYQNKIHFVRHYVNFNFIYIKTVQNSHLILINILRDNSWHHSYCQESDKKRNVSFVLPYFAMLHNKSRRDKI